MLHGRVHVSPTRTGRRSGPPSRPDPCYCPVTVTFTSVTLLRFAAVFCSDQTTLDSDCDCVGSARGPQLPVNQGDVELGGGERDEEGRPYLPVSHAVAHQLQDLQIPIIQL